MATATERGSIVPGKMWAANVKKFHEPWTLEQIPVPGNALDKHDILIKVAVASFCHTDMMVINGLFHDKPSGMSGSHEPSGTVVALGVSAAESFSIGDRVIAIGIQNPCGDCMDCNGPPEFRLSCKFNRGYSGISAPGAFQEYTIVDDRFTVRIPDSLSFLKAAPLTCAGCTSWRAIKRANVRANGWLGIVGSGGGLGHLAIQFATKMKINVIGLEARDVGLELTKKAGANAAVDVRIGVDATVQEVRKIIGPRNFGRGDDLCDAVLVLTEARSAVHTAMAITKGHGTVVEVAQPDKVEFPFQEMIFRDIRLIGSNLSSREELEDQVRFVVENDVEVETTVFHGLHSLDKLYSQAKEGQAAGKFVVIVDEEQVKE